MWGKDMVVPSCLKPARTRVPRVIRSGGVRRFQQVAQVGDDAYKQVRVDRLVDGDMKALDRSSILAECRCKYSHNQQHQVKAPRAESAVILNSLL